MTTSLTCTHRCTTLSHRALRARGRVVLTIMRRRAWCRPGRCSLLKPVALTVCLVQSFIESINRLFSILARWKRELWEDEVVGAVL